MSSILHLQIESSSGIPIYRQIMDQIRNYVNAGALRSGDRLPSIRDLARRLHINPTTITKAYGELQHAGVVELVHGKGVFIADGATRVSRPRVEAELRRLAAALAAAAHQVGFSAADTTRMVREEMTRLVETASKRKG